MRSRSGFARTALLLLAAPLFADVASIRSLIRGGRFAEAVAECDRELKAAPRNAALLTLRGLALQASGARTEALAAFRAAIGANPSYEAGLAGAAQIEFDIRDAAAATTLAAVLRVNPASEPAHAMLGTLLFEQRRCGEAIPHFEKAAAALAGPAVKWPYGVCLLTSERWIEAAAQFADLLRLREHAATRYNLGLSYWNAKDYKAAAATLAPLETSGGPAAARLLASALDLSGDTPKAFAVLRKAVEANPRDEDPLIDFAVLCVDHKAEALGLEVVREGIRLNPASAKLRTLLGVLLVRGGEPEKGQQAFREAQALSPESGLGRIGLASALMQMGLASEAAKVLREQLAESGPDARAELTLARALLLGEGSTTAAREAAGLLRAVVMREPGNAAAFGLLGKAELLLGDQRAAANAFAAALRADPADRASAYQLMRLYQRTGRAREAAELSRRVREFLDKERADEASAGRFRVVRESN